MLDWPRAEVMLWFVMQCRVWEKVKRLREKVGCYVARREVRGDTAGAAHFWLTQQPDAAAFCIFCLARRSLLWVRFHRLPAVTGGIENAGPSPCT